MSWFALRIIDFEIFVMKFIVWIPKIKESVFDNTNFLLFLKVKDVHMYFFLILSVVKSFICRWIQRCVMTLCM